MKLGFQTPESAILLLLLLLSRFSRVRLCDPIDGSRPGSPVPACSLFCTPSFSGVLVETMTTEATKVLSADTPSTWARAGLGGRRGRPEAKMLLGRQVGSLTVTRL